MSVENWFFTSIYPPNGNGSNIERIWIKLPNSCCLAAKSENRKNEEKKVFRERILHCIYNKLNHLISKSIWSSWTECVLHFYNHKSIPTSTDKTMHSPRPFSSWHYHITCAWFGQSIPVYLTENNEYFHIQHVPLINWISYFFPTILARIKFFFLVDTILIFHLNWILKKFSSRTVQSLCFLIHSVRI